MTEFFDEYIVYAQTDAAGRITALNSSAFVGEDWGTEIDRGEGDKYHHAQGNHLTKPIYTEDGIPRYRLQDGKAVERTQQEIDSERLEPEKQLKIEKTKADLEQYLFAHPITWTDGKQYSITREKQQQLTSKLFAASIASQGSQNNYKLTWNSTGEECVEWSLQDLFNLAFVIDTRVTALVSHQQKLEIQIKNTSSLEELEAIKIDYNEVK